MTPIEEITQPTPEEFEAKIRPAFRPVVIRGVGADWPIVQHGHHSASAALTYLRSFDSGAPTDVMLAPPEERGRFFYKPDMRGFNFQKQQASLSQLSAKLEEFVGQDTSPGMYAGATAVRSHLPGISEENAFALVANLPDATPRIWLGNATQVATHFDMSDNFAVVAVGTRRFTVFPPDATPDLYVGPLNVTLAGQPVSMVNPLDPDTDRYPLYETALAKAQFADLEPGDAIYIPTLWWHHVTASAPINILMNYWHNDAAHGGGFLALVHALLSIRDLPQAERDAWRVWFDHFIFGPDAGSAANHLPPHGRGINGPASDARTQQMRQFIAQVISQN